MKFTLKILLVLPSAVYILLGCENVDGKVYQSAIETTRQLKAEIIKHEGGLFSDKYFLKISNLRDSTWYQIDRDLLEGHGGYESEIIQIKWLSPDKLFIERALADQPYGLIYSVSQVKFENVRDSMSTLFPREKNIR